MLQKPNVLVLDEPTNHLDLEAINALNVALQKYEGTVLLVTHDEDLLEEVGTRVWRFEGGRIVDASATSDEEFLLGTLDTDEGARRLGEFGIGCNPGIQQHMRNTLFDEKMEGTIHLAIGTSFPQLGGLNKSAVHWDMVKELRNGGRIELDGTVVQQEGEWRI